MKKSILFFFVAFTTLSFGQVPTSTFTVSPENICGCMDTVYVTYTGNASPSATYNWQFNTTGLIIGSGMGPYSIFYCELGTIPISLSVNDNGNISDTTVLIVNSYLCDRIKTNNVGNINVYPNPAQDNIFINTSKKIFMAEILDLTGKVILKEKLNSENILNISTLEKGFYILHLNSNNETTNLTFIKQ